MQHSLPHARHIFCNRSLDLRGIKAIGYDMDYTLVHYRVEAWEAEAYACLLVYFKELGWPVDALQFDPLQVRRGLIIDRVNGNLLKANRFGLIRQGCHGTQPLNSGQLRSLYAHTVVHLAEPRWIFLNALFSLSEGCLYAQLVDLLDARLLPAGIGYSELYGMLQRAMDAAHTEGVLKARILANPDRYVNLDPEIPLTLLDQRQAGKKLLLVTNSDWAYTVPMMRYCFDRFLPEGCRWQDLFSAVVISARKPDFFTSNMPLYEVVTEDGLLRPSVGPLDASKLYVGGSAHRLEQSLGVTGAEVLYVGDHMFGDVHVTKNALRWRTALILREIEGEVEEASQQLGLVAQRAALEGQQQTIATAINRLKTLLGRRKGRYGPPVSESEDVLLARLDALEQEALVLSEALAELPTEDHQQRWGAMMRCDNDKSHLAFQVERYADIYTSRVSNFLYATPYACFQAPRSRLPHDGG